MARRPVHPLWLVAGCSLWMACAGNSALWKRLMSLGMLQSPSGWALALALLGLLAASLAGLTALLAWRRSLKPALTALLFVTALASYFMNSYGVVMDPTMVTNVVQTDVDEALALWSIGLAVEVALLALLPSWLVWRQPVAFDAAPKQFAKNLAACALCAVAIVVLLALSYQAMASTMRNHKELRYLLNPLAGLYSGVRVALKPFALDPNVRLPIGAGLHAGTANAEAGLAPFTLMLVIGETARSDNFRLNGYPRDTNPELSRLDVVSFRNAWSCGTSTAESLPCMVSHLTRTEFGARTANYENLLDVLQKAGLAVLWLGNQSGCKEVCNRIPHQMLPDSCADGPCFDEALLEGLGARLERLGADRRARGTVVVLHQMGSHGPAYHRRSPAQFKAFLPECTTSALKDCSRETVVNAYDNSLRYTDHFLARSIGWLQRNAPRSALMYVSDHGESLGESNIYLHGLPYSIAPDHQKKVPWIAWMSPEFASHGRLSTACLRRKADERISHDHYFHSVLGLAQISIAEYQPDLDLFHACRGRAE